MTGEKITFCFYEFYPTNFPYCNLLNALIDYGVFQEKEIEVITYKKDIPSTRMLMERFSAGDVRFRFINRPFNSKLFSYLYFALATFVTLLVHSKGDVVVPTTPPVFMGFSAALAKVISFGRFQLIYHVQDIHPELSSFSKNKKNWVVEKLFILMDTFTLKHCDKLITLSDDMAATLLARDRSIGGKICVVNNFHVSSDENLETEKTDLPFEFDSQKINFIYAGNVGRYQNMEVFVRLFCQAGDDRARLYILGDGDRIKAVKETVNQANKTENVFFLGQVDSATAEKVIEKADFGVVSLLPGLLKFAYPSKVISYLCAGVPLFVLADSESELGKTITEHHLGFIVDCCDVNTFSQLVKLACDDVNIKKTDVRKIGKKLFGDNIAVRRIYDCIDR